MQTVTKRQLEKIIHAWKVDAKIPSKNQKTVVCFPNTPDYDFRLATIRKTDLKSGDGRVLYSIEFSND
jgi:hypothetical protein